jgi:hypothetical protein
LMREARGAYGSDITQSKNANPAHFEVFSLVAMRALPRIQISRQVLSRKLNSSLLNSSLRNSSWMSEGPAMPTQRTKRHKILARNYREIG